MSAAPVVFVVTPFSVAPGPATLDDWTERSGEYVFYHETGRVHADPLTGLGTIWVRDTKIVPSIASWLESAVFRRSVHLDSRTSLAFEYETTELAQNACAHVSGPLRAHVHPPIGMERELPVRACDGMWMLGRMQFRGLRSKEEVRSVIQNTLLFLHAAANQRYAPYDETPIVFSLAKLVAFRTDAFNEVDHHVHIQHTPRPEPVQIPECINCYPNPPHSSLALSQIWTNLASPRKLCDTCARIWKNYQK